MKSLISRFSVAILCSSIVAIASAEDFPGIGPTTTTITSAESSYYCFPQTSVRGNYDSLIIDHNVIIPPEDQSKSGTIFVGARFKSKPGDLWLLHPSYEWRKVNSDADLASAMYYSFEKLPLVVPISVFYGPADIRAAIGDGEIWVGYGLGSFADQTSKAAFDDMTKNQRYSLLWEAPPSLTYMPQSGLSNSLSRLCFNVNEVLKIGDTFNDVIAPPPAVVLGGTVTPAQ
ncbi:MAG: hypothetical protein LBF16_02520 [Pseudomonadales bacterium]|jgi:hypothetical protein|nr:hypothetical protein [Pseudomonadales bacterium]